MRTVFHLQGANKGGVVSNLKTIEIKTFVPAKDPSGVLWRFGQNV